MKETKKRKTGKRTTDQILLESAVKYVIQGEGNLEITKIGNLLLPKRSLEATRCEEIKNMLADYAGRPKAPRPFSIAIFGPPGSGKSFTAKQIVKSAGGNFSEPLTLNLSQLSAPNELAAAFKKGAPKNATSVFFFDEFDAPLQGLPLGWLRWFLAPMQDGNFFAKGESIPIARAVFVFAGGTAASFEEFEHRAYANPAEYRDKKVPDFISRLRGFIDIQGINNLDEERSLRRALVLARQLRDRWPTLDEEAFGGFPIPESQIHALLSTVHFIHGVRSMEALLDMCRLDGTPGKRRVHMPDPELSKLHLSRGPLDRKIIGISAGQDDSEPKRLLQRVADLLLRDGATLAYGGPFVRDGTLENVINAADRLPDWGKRRDKRIRNYLGYPSYKGSSDVRQRSQPDKDVEFLNLRTLSEDELRELEVPRDAWFAALPDLQTSEPYHSNRHLAWAISLFRMRVRLIQDVHALIVVGGKDDGLSWGRFSGIAEEVMLAIALGKPVYVLGGAGGGAHAVGRLLGLDTTIANPQSCLVASEPNRTPAPGPKFAEAFNIAGCPPLPRTTEQLRTFLFENGITTSGWPSNGLTLEENRDLFCARLTRSEKDLTDLILRGLSRLSWKYPSRPPI